MGHRGLREYLSRFRISRVEDRMIEDVPPIPVIIVGHAQTADTVVRQAVNAAGEVTEASAAASSNVLAQIREYLETFPFNSDSDGGLHTTGGPWIPFAPITVTADGAGNPPATQLAPLNAGNFIDVMIWMENDLAAGAGEYIHRFRTDPLGAVGGIAAVDPVFAAVVIPTVANSITPKHAYGHRMITTVVANAYGIADGANGDWPLNANVTYSGFYRYVA